MMITGLVFVLILWLAYFLVVQRALLVKHIDVDGNGLVNTDDVITAAGVSLGESMFKVDKGVINQDVTTALPEVESVVVERQWPDTLTLHITERTAVFQVPADGQYGLVGADGTVFHFGPKSASVPTCSAQVGNPVLLADVATVIEALPAGLRPHLQSVSATSVDAIVLQLDGGRQVIWGSADQSELKSQVVMALLAVPGTIYDVSAPSAPAVR